MLVFKLETRSLRGVLTISFSTDTDMTDMTFCLSIFLPATLYQQNYLTAIRKRTTVEEGI